MHKAIKILSLFLLITLNCNCQVTATLPLDSYDYSYGAYLKDLNNELTFYEGTWVGVYDNKKYTFQFTIFYQYLTDYGNGNYHYEDSLMGKFKVEDLVSGQIIFNDLLVTNYDDYKIFLASVKSGSFIYSDAQNCNNTVEFSLFKVTGTTNQLYYNQFELRDFSNSLIDCPYENQEDIPMFLPQGNFILTRQ